MTGQRVSSDPRAGGLDWLTLRRGVREMAQGDESGVTVMDVLGRCYEARRKLYELHDATTDLPERRRLRAKASGVDLVIGYVEEMRRG